LHFAFTNFQPNQPKGAHRVELRPLTDEDFDSVYTAFLEAFSDYYVKMNPTREQFAEMLTRRGYFPAASAGTFDGNRLVAFTLNGVEGPGAYDTGTGVVPSHRRHGLGRAVMERSYSLLREQQCTHYLLEVLEANVSAIALYRSGRFSESRRLQCWSFESTERQPANHLSSLEAKALDWKKCQTWWNVKPSWQNSTGSICRAREQFVVIGETDGYAILFPASGDLPQLAVNPGCRRQGIGTRLLRTAAVVANKPLRIMNVDDGDETVNRFLEAVGARRTLRQIEMQREL
jgi:ribosomal protein S18 acetylase RimI-like enzyme